MKFYSYDYVLSQISQPELGDGDYISLLGFSDGIFRL